MRKRIFSIVVTENGSEIQPGKQCKADQLAQRALQRSRAMDLDAT